MQANLPGLVPSIEVVDVSKRYGKFQALNNLSLSLSGAKLVGLMGPNGCGKTTLLKIIAGLLTDYEGSVRVCGHPVGATSKSLLSFLPDTIAVDQNRSLRHTVKLYGDLFSDFDEAKANEMLTYFDLDTSRTIRALSKGMKEKLQIALAMSRQASIYVLDEPLSGVDPAARSEIMAGIMKGFTNGSLMLVSTHLVSELEDVADEVVFMRKGEVILYDNTDDLRAREAKSMDQLFREMFAR